MPASVHTLRKSAPLCDPGRLHQGRTETARGKVSRPSSRQLHAALEGVITTWAHRIANMPASVHTLRKSAPLKLSVSLTIESLPQIADGFPCLSRDERDYVTQEDFIKGARKLQEATWQRRSDSLSNVAIVEVGLVLPASTTARSASAARVPLPL
jgi:hypothetical protein